MSHWTCSRCFRSLRDNEPGCGHEECIREGVRAAVALVREAAALYASHEGTAAEVASDYSSRVALESCASNIELTLLKK